MKLNDLELKVSTYSVIRRDGSVVPFTPDKIRIAVSKAFLFDHNGVQRLPGHSSLSSSALDIVGRVVESVVRAVTSRKSGGGAIHIEDIQDQVELSLMRLAEFDVAKGYVLYREQRATLRATQQSDVKLVGHFDDGSVIDPDLISQTFRSHCSDLAGVDVEL